MEAGLNTMEMNKIITITTLFLIIAVSGCIQEQPLEGISPNDELSIAVWDNDVSYARMLIKNGAKIEEGLLSYSVVMETKEMTKLLLESGANPNDENSLGSAIVIGDYPLVKLLIDYGVDVNKKYDKMTPLQQAHYYERDEITELLKENGALWHGYKEDYDYLKSKTLPENISSIPIMDCKVFSTDFIRNEEIIVELEKNNLSENMFNLKDEYWLMEIELKCNIKNNTYNNIWFMLEARQYDFEIPIVKYNNITLKYSNDYFIEKIGFIEVYNGTYFGIYDTSKLARSTKVGYEDYKDYDYAYYIKDIPENGDFTLYFTTMSSGTSYNDISTNITNIAFVSEIEYNFRKILDIKLYRAYHVPYKLIG